MPETRLTLEQAQTLAALLDAVIPASRNGRMPGAGEVGLAASVDAALAPGSEPRATLLRGLDSLAAAARARGAASLAALPPDARREVLAEVTAAEPALVPSLLFHVYAGYYQSPRVLEALGLEARPPHPLGYPLEEGDLGLLDPVRERPPLWRRC